MTKKLILSVTEDSFNEIIVSKNMLEALYNTSRDDAEKALKEFIDFFNKETEECIANLDPDEVEAIAHEEACRQKDLDGYLKLLEHVKSGSYKLAINELNSMDTFPSNSTPQEVFNWVKISDFYFHPLIHRLLAS